MNLFSGLFSSGFHLFWSLILKTSNMFAVKQILHDINDVNFECVMLVSGNERTSEMNLYSLQNTRIECLRKEKKKQGILLSLKI